MADDGRPTRVLEPSVRYRAYLTFATRDAWRLLTGPRADGRPRLAGLPAIIRRYVALGMAERAGRRARAAGLARELLVPYPDLRLPLWSVAADERRHGEIGAASATIARLRPLAAPRAVRVRAAELDDWRRETDPTWLPAIPGPARPVVPDDPTSVLHLLKVSLPDRQSGYTIRSREVLRAQRTAGLAPQVVTPYGYPPDRPGGPAPSVEDVDGIRHHRLSPGAPLTGLLDTVALERTAAGAADIAVAERPAVLHAASGHRGYELALAGLALREHLRRPLVYEVRGFLEASWTGQADIAATAATAELTVRRRAQEDRILRSVDGVTTLGMAMRDELIARGVPVDRISVVPNGIDPEAFAPTPRDPDLVARYGLGDRWVFGYVSNMDHFREGHDLLIDATAKLVEQGRQVVCLLVGDGTLRPQLEARARAAGVAAAVVFTGQVPHDQVRAHYALFDAFVIARAEDRAARFTTPLKPYEAMAMGLPLVVSDLPALTEIVARDERGLVVPVGDPGAIAAALGTLMDQPERGQQLAAAGRSWVLAERTWAANGPRYRELYAAVVERYDREAVISSS